MYRSDLGLVGSQYRVTGHIDAHPDAVEHCFEIGDIIMLRYDDGSHAPDFCRVSDGLLQFVHLSELEPLAAGGEL
jgi:hypothetical protein